MAPSRSTTTNNVTSGFPGNFHHSNAIGQLNVTLKAPTLSIKDLFSLPDFDGIHADIQRERKDGTGKWILQAPVFKRWVSRPRRTLVCMGKAGVGKTVLVSNIRDHLLAKFKDEIERGSVGLACIYCNHSRQSNKNAISVLASLLVQLVAMRGGSPDGEMEGVFQKLAKYQTFPRARDLCNLLSSEISRYSRVFLIVDGLDEISEEGDCRKEVIGYLKELRSLSSAAVSLMVTSRPHVRVNELSPVRYLKMRSNLADLTRYVESWMADMLRPGIEYSPEAKERIVQEILQIGERTFLLVKLHTNALSLKEDPNDVLRAVRDLPPDISRAYDSTINRLQNTSHAELARKILYWLTFTHRPLTVEALQYALAPSLESSAGNIPVNLHFWEYVCAGLVVVNPESHIVRLTHMTLREYLEKHQKPWLLKGQSIALTCLQSLSEFTGNYNPSQKILNQLSCHPLVTYAAQYWGVHMRHEYKAKSKQELEDLETAALNFLRHSDQVQCSIKLLGLSQYKHRWRKNVQGIHLAAYFGLTELLEELLKSTKVDINTKDNQGVTALHWAVRKQHTDTVQRLLDEPEIKVNTRDNYGTTALHLAAINGNKNIVSLLLQTCGQYKPVGCKNVNLQDRHGLTPLHYAAANGHSKIISVLLENGAKVNRRERGGGTPLCEAIENGSRAIFETLLCKTTKLNHVYCLPEFEYHWARLGYILWKKLRENSSCTPDEKMVIRRLRAQVQAFGASYEHWERRNREWISSRSAGDESSSRRIPSFDKCPKLYLRSGRIWGEVFTRTRTKPIRVATRLRFNLEHALWVKLFFHRFETFSSVLAYQYYRTPLSRAAEKGKENIIEQLLATHGSHFKHKKFIRTPLSLAAQNGHLNIIKCLVQNGMSHVDFPFMDGRTPLSYAAESGHHQVVEYLLKNDTVNPDTRQTHVLCQPEVLESASMSEIIAIFADCRILAGRTPLSYAAENGHEKVVELLLRSNRVNVNSIDGRRETPLSYAHKNGHHNVVGLLRRSGGLDLRSEL